jgi:hypothetical protein
MVLLQGLVGQVRKPCKEGLQGSVEEIGFLEVSEEPVLLFHVVGMGSRMVSELHHPKGHHSIPIRDICFQN